ncbi:MAG: hypothetical protein JWN41_470, partial [Thermoleophilia bacterium]|nr:hypothetical protein [Thermoleophilia bacterium]
EFVTPGVTNSRWGGDCGPRGDSQGVTEPASGKRNRMTALVIALAIVVVLLAVFWRTLHDQAHDQLEPTLAEHAAADAGRAAPASLIGPHDATTNGPPAFFDEVVVRDRNGHDVR